VADGARIIAHIDMDAFFASVEQLDHPELRGKPVLVGGASRRGVVAAASYEARPFGVHSAMPMRAALERCPQAIVVPARHDRYADVSADVFGVLRTFTPIVEGLSLDEAFLDLTGSAALFGDGETMARKIRAAIFERTGLKASAGVAPCKFVAKVASDLSKPDGLLLLRQADVQAFLEPLPIERMWGIGVKTAPKLHQLGLHTLGHLARADAREIEHLLGTFGLESQALARGIDPRPVNENRLAKSVAAEETFEDDLRGRAALEPHVLEQSARVARRLCREGLLGRTVTVKIKYFDFRVETRRTTMSNAVGDTDSLYEAARELLGRFDLARPVRLTGVSVSELCTEGSARSLFPEPEAERRRRLEEVGTRIADRFGPKGLVRAALLDRPGRG
jgi:DNA polymerase-4